MSALDCVLSSHATGVPGRLIEEMTAASNQERGWELLSDPSVPRGDCIVHRGPSMVDASLEERVRAAMLQVLGGDRAEDGPS